MSNTAQLPEWIFNINTETKGIERKLADGLSARIFVGENAIFLL